MRPLVLRLHALIGFLLAALLAWPLATRANVLELDALRAEHDAWRAATVLFDPGGGLGVDQALQRAGDFATLDAPPGNLGRRSGAVWLRLPVRVPIGGSGRWVLEVDYAPLDLIAVYVLDGTRVERQGRLGDHVPVAQRPEPARSHILSLDLPPGAERLLLLRVQTTGTMLAPLWLRTPSGYHVSEAQEQALQGLIAGMALCLMLYSLAQWVVLRDPLFVLYALTLGGTGASSRHCRASARSTSGAAANGWRSTARRTSSSSASAAPSSSCCTRCRCARSARGWRR